MAKHLVSMECVKDQLENPKVRIIDCRFVLGQPTVGKEEYLAEHIPGAFYMDLEQDLSGPIKEHGGRHPLPDLAEFPRKLGNVGIDETVTVVAYDDQSGAMASRLWWLLQYLGHPEVYVMDGVFSQWKAKGYPVTAELPKAESKTFTAKVQKHMLVNMEEVKERIGKEGTIIIDSREEKRYKGIEEPIDRVAGHIPSAVNHFWKDGLNERGTWKTRDEQKERFQAVKPSDEVIVYCGSGVTACPNVLALKEAGYTNVKLYAGSWSDWITYPENPIATKKEKE
ncbi:sulfurtransferase [Effusibacillus consociatus]|uniref:Sulfurtransferase n=1 Tax=Effusibacillus consociatus TaxID=1117041 RepID=A0ABV9Q5D0_9BACL